MRLTRATAAEAVEGWSAGLAAPWSGSQEDALVDRIRELADVVVPHIVDDRPLAEERVQTYLLRRAVARLEDWLVQAAARQRRALGLEALRLRPSSERPALGLRTADQAELEALPAIGPALADRLRRHLAARPGVGRMEALLEVDGVGPARLDHLRSAGYLEEPAVALVSPTLWAFVLEPTVPHALALIERTDASLVLGDHNAFARRVPDQPADPRRRFAAFVDLVVDRSRVSAPGAAGTLASEIDRWLSRHETLEALSAGAADAAGAVLTGADYVDAARAEIDAAAESVRVMMFLGTPTAGDEDLSPLPLVEALEAAGARGVEVRVVLDQDDGGEPYRSAFINRALVERLEPGPVSVKRDTEETLLHSKVLVVDDEACIVGSHNWTRSSFTRSHELSVLVASPEVAGAFGDRFDALWDELPVLDGP